MAYRIIDAHFHPCSSYQPSCLENMRQAFEIMDTYGLDGLCLQSVSLWYPWTLQLNPLLLLMKLCRPGRIYAFGGLRYPPPHAEDKRFDYADQAKRLIALGFDGIKMFAKPTVRREFGEPINSPVFDELFAFLSRKRIPLLYHVADPDTFWDIRRIPDAFWRRGWYYGEGYPSQEQIFAECEDVLDRFPALNILLPHFYFHSDRLDRLSALLDAHPNLRIDCTPGIEMYYNFSRNPEVSRAFFLRYRDRIHFGTDNFGRAAGAQLDYLSAAGNTLGYVRSMLENGRACIDGEPQTGLYLPPDVLQRIYADNFLAWAGPAPKPVCPQAALEYTREVRAHSKAVSADIAERETGRIQAVMEQLLEGRELTC